MGLWHRRGLSFLRIRTAKHELKTRIKYGRPGSGEPGRFFFPPNPELRVEKCSLGVRAGPSP